LKSYLTKYLVKLPLDTQVCLLSSLSVLLLGLGLHRADHYPFDWLTITHLLLCVLIFTAAYIAGHFAEYPRACSLSRTFCFSTFIALCTVITLHVLPLSPFPMRDSALARADQLLGFNTGRFSMAIRNHHPDIKFFFDVAYAALIPISYFSLLTLSWFSAHRARELILLMSLSSFFGLFLYFFLPAIGPMASYHYTMSNAELALLKNINLVRKDGPASQLFLTGDISFPSFHTILAIFCAWVWRDYKIIFIPLCLISFLIILSTLTTGWHYLSDVLGGILISFVSIYSAKLIFKSKTKNNTQNNKSFELADLIPSAPQVG